MSEVFFYHLTRSSMPQTVVELCDKCLSRDWNVLINGANEQGLKQLDQALWREPEEGFSPHGLADEANAALQPVLLSMDSKNRNESQVLMLVDGAQFDVEIVADFARVCLIFDGNSDEQLQKARADWKLVTGAGVPAQYWSQESGKWEMKAEAKMSSNEG